MFSPKLPGTGPQTKAMQDVVNAQQQQELQQLTEVQKIVEEAEKALKAARKEAVAAQKAALALSVKKFLLYFQVKSICDKHKVIVLSSNYELYSDLSAKMMQIIGRFASEQFVYSIDESFVSLNLRN